MLIIWLPAHDRKMEQMQLEMQKHRITEINFNKYISDLQNENTEKTIKLHQSRQPRTKPPFKSGMSINGSKYLCPKVPWQIYISQECY
jgi:hypothetical protein